MRAIEMTTYGGPDVLRLAEVPDPEPGPGQVIVRVHASGVNFADTMMREGRYALNPQLPAVLGSEVAGIAERLGEGVTTPALGARVAAPLFAAGVLTGGYAEKVCLPADLLVPIPAGVSFEDAVALQVQGLTAVYLLKQVPVEGRSILVHAAAGGVGSLLVQLAKRQGARAVIAAASTNAKRELALKLGADAAADYTVPEWPESVRAATDGAGADVIFNAGAGAPRTSLQALAFGGSLVIYGSLSLRSFDLGPAEIADLVFKNAAIRGFALPTLLTPSGLREELPKLFSLAENGSLKVVHGGAHPLAEAAEAHRALESRASVGKLVLIP